MLTTTHVAPSVPIYEKEASSNTYVLICEVRVGFHTCLHAYVAISKKGNIYGDI